VEWKIWSRAINEAILDGDDITKQLGEWYDDGGHRHTEWYLDTREGIMYRWQEGKWERHEARKGGIPRFKNEGTPVNKPDNITHKAQATVRYRYIDVEKLFHLRKQ
jgi:hypothetical protein